MSNWYWPPHCCNAVWIDMKINILHAWQVYISGLILQLHFHNNEVIHIPPVHFGLYFSGPEGCQVSLSFRHRKIVLSDQNVKTVN